MRNEHLDKATKLVAKRVQYQAELARLGDKLNSMAVDMINGHGHSQWTKFAISPGYSDCQLSSKAADLILLLVRQDLERSITIIETELALLGLEL
jgi:hypothetical protein